ncbi:lipopolysaccharide biosynthesis protein [Sediminibacterium soli]|uniref:lipopolysaccharide biosynthesis protein n=1 Tax=Sediminibacterium soli TaxID=2698829 RepID=UPI00137AAB54|nr:hypothetical protein [Sediminibacterium soli]NCI48081.1 hypothetical protein [Sediminibacterium soli]
MFKNKSLLKNVAANSITMGLMTLFQLLSVPVFLKYWGVELYGEWITLNTLTAYFQMTDIGLNTATGNSFTFNYVRGQFEKCTILINNNIFFILIAFIAIFLFVVGLGRAGVFVHLFHFSLIQSSEVDTCLFLLFFQVMIGTFNNLLNTFYTATGNYARGIMIDNFIRFSEYAALLLSVVLKFSIVYVLLFGVLVKLVGFIGKFIDSSRFYKLSLGIRYLRRAELKETFLPALSFFSFPIANSLSFQGVTLLINFFLGSTSVVIFNTTRTLVNFCKSSIDILHKSVWPEISITYGKMDILRLRKIHYRTMAYSVVLAIITTIVLFFLGNLLYTTWTRGAVKFDPILFTLLLVSLIANTIWSSSTVLLQATNNHKKFSLFYLFAAMLIFIASLLVLAIIKQVRYIPLSILFVDILLVYYVVKRALSITDDSLSLFLIGVWAAIKDMLKLVSNIFFTISR